MRGRVRSGMALAATCAAACMAAAWLALSFPAGGGARGTYLDENAMLARSTDPTVRGDAGAAAAAGEIAAAAAAAGEGLAATTAALHTAAAAARATGAAVTMHACREDRGGGDGGGGSTASQFFVARWRAPRASGSEAIVLATASASQWLAAGITSGEGSAAAGADALALALAGTIGAHVAAAPWIAKDVVWVAAESNAALADALELYIGKAEGAAACGGEEAMGAGSDTPGPLPASSIFGAVVVSVEDVWGASGELAPGERGALRVLCEGYEGALPNLDLPTLALHMAKRQRLRGMLATPVALRLPLADSSTYITLPARHAALVSALVRAAGGKPTGAHAEFKRYNVDAVTMSVAAASASAGANSRAQYPPGSPEVLALALAPHVRALELTLRSLNSLLERFHHSHIQYALIDERTFVDAGVLVAPLGTLLVPLALAVRALMERMYPMPVPQDGKDGAEDVRRPKSFGACVSVFAWARALVVCGAVYLWGAAWPRVLIRHLSAPAKGELFAAGVAAWVTAAAALLACALGAAWAVCATTMPLECAHTLASVSGAESALAKAGDIDVKESAEVQSYAAAHITAQSGQLKARLPSWRSCRWMQLKCINLSACGLALVGIGCYNLALATLVGLVAVPMCLLAVPLALPGKSDGAGAIAQLLMLCFSPLVTCAMLCRLLGLDAADALHAWLATDLEQGFAAPWFVLGAYLPLHVICLLIAFCPTA